MVAMGGLLEDASVFRRPGLSALAIGAPSSFVDTVGRSVLENIENARDNIDGVSGACGGSVPALPVAGSATVPLPGYTSVFVFFFGRSEGKPIVENMMLVFVCLCKQGDPGASTVYMTRMAQAAVIRVVVCPHPAASIVVCVVVGGWWLDAASRLVPCRAEPRALAARVAIGTWHCRCQLPSGQFIAGIAVRNEFKREGVPRSGQYLTAVSQSRILSAVICSHSPLPAPPK